MGHQSRAAPTLVPVSKSFRPAVIASHTMQLWKHDAETVAAFAVEPLPHLIGDGLLNADQGQPCASPEAEDQLPDGQLLGGGQHSDPFLRALAGISRRNHWEKTSRSNVLASAPQSDGQRGNSALLLRQDVGNL